MKFFALAPFRKLCRDICEAPKKSTHNEFSSSPILDLISLWWDYCFKQKKGKVSLIKGENNHGQMHNFSGTNLINIKLK